MTNPWRRIRLFFRRELWSLDPSSLTGTKAFLVDAAKMLAVIVRDVLHGHLTLWAMGLVYTTLVSLVPLLAVSFSVLKAFGVQNKLEPFLLDVVAPLGPNGVVLARRLVEFVNNVQVGVLGAVGLALLFFTVINLIQQAEKAFNAIWRVRGMRGILQRFSDYLSVVLIGPVLVVSALALTATLMSTTLVQKIVAVEPFGAVVGLAGRLIPYVLVCAAFTFLYVFVPNTRVRFVPALAGGVIGGVLWETLGWAFASFMVASTQYAAIYSGFAIIILFMFWLYLSWLILLIGVEISFYVQNPQMLSVQVWANLPNARLIEQTAVSIMYLTASHFYSGKPPLTGNSIAERLGLAVGTVQDMIAALKEKGLIIETGDDPPAYVPARDIAAILLRDIYDAVRHRTEDPSGRLNILPVEPVSSLLQEIDGVIGGTLKDTSLRDFVAASLPAGTEGFDPN